MRWIHGGLVMAAVGAVALAAACGGSTPPAETSGAAPAETAAPEAPKVEEPKPEEAKPVEAAKPAWKDMNHDQKVELMKTAVMPKMSALFKEFDPKEFADVTCATCHGPGAKEGKFDMPNPKLGTLDRTNGFAKHLKKHEKITKFMMEKVPAEMASALGVPKWTPETPDGFGCGGCHVMTGK